MKRNRKHNIFGWLAASALLLTTACTDNADLGMGQGGTDGTNIVTLTVQTQSQSGGTRADNNIENSTKYSRIGKGSEVDILIFAVYEKKSDGTYTLLENYSKDTSLTIDDEEFTCATGQNIIKFAKDVHTEDEGVELQFATDKTKTYAVAFWAQSHKCTAYNTEDLEAVSVNYGSDAQAATNNDECRDAFCAVAIIEENAVTTVNGAKVTDGSNTVILRRPFAQINVGTTGADYHNILAGTNVFPNAGLTQSKIVLKGVAQCFNVVENKVETDNNEKKLVNVTFDYANLPAFFYMNSVPNTETGLLGSTDITDNEEEFLFVDLDGNGIKDYVEATSGNKGKNGYLTEYPTIDAQTNTFKTETFKYLSMCYVLVPAKEENTSSTVDVEVWFSGNYMAGNAGAKTPTGSAVAYKAISLNNVPVQRNWRTNILGGLHDQNVPDDDPFDPSSVFNLTRAIIAVCPCYDNENNVGFDEKKENYWDWAPTPGSGTTDGKDADDED